jgi:hypothetical protein
MEDRVARKREINRLAALRSRKIRKARMQQQSVVINDLQKKLAGVLEGNSVIMEHVATVIETANRLLYMKNVSGSGHVGDVAELHKSLLALGSFFETVACRDRSIMDSGLMSYHTYDV